MEIVSEFSGPQFSRWVELMKQCANFLEVGEVPDLVAGPGVFQFKVARTWFCKVPRCPMCMWRRACQWLARLYQSLEEIERDHPTAEWLFLTFTVRNCHVSEVRATLDRAHRGFTKLTRRREWRTVEARRGKSYHPFIGWLRTSEVSKGEDGPMQAHPHVHCLALVSPSYFSGPYYIRQKRYRELWADCAGLDYDPSVHVTKVKQKGVSDPADPYKGLRAAIAETMKYAVKPADYHPDNGEYLEELFSQLHKVRMVGTGGEFRQYLRARKNDTEEMIEGDGDGDTSDKNPGGYYYTWRIDGSPRYGFDRRRTLGV